MLAQFLTDTVKPRLINMIRREIRTRAIWLHELPQRKENEMKNYQKVLCATVLAVLVLASPAFAGDIQHPIAPPDPQPSSSRIHTGATGGEIHTDKSASLTEADTARGITLTLVQNLLILF